MGLVTAAAPNPLQQTWAHTATHRNMGNRQQLAHTLDTEKNNLKNQQCFMPNVSVLYFIVSIMNNQDVNERCDKGNSIT